MSTVLIVEDDFAIASLLEESLEDDGYQITNIARTVKEAIDCIKLQAPDFAVIDLNLAYGGSGCEVATHLRRVSATTGILFSTGSDYHLYPDLRGDAVMTKPYSMFDVSKALKIIKQIRVVGDAIFPHPHNFQLLSENELVEVE